MLCDAVRATPATWPYSTILKRHRDSSPALCLCCSTLKSDDGPKNQPTEARKGCG